MIEFCKRKRANSFEPESLHVFRLEIDFIEKQRRIYSLIKLIAHHRLHSSN